MADSSTAIVPLAVFDLAVPDESGDRPPAAGLLAARRPGLTTLGSRRARRWLGGRAGLSGLVKVPVLRLRRQATCRAIDPGWPPHTNARKSATSGSDGSHELTLADDKVSHRVASYNSVYVIVDVLKRAVRRSAMG